jgi:hypothetical protein
LTPPKWPLISNPRENKLTENSFGYRFFLD